MKKLTFLSIIFLVINFQAFATTSSNFINNQFLHKPLLSHPKLINFTTGFTYSSANKAFDAQGKQVSYLQQYGAEDMLKRFTDASLKRTDTTSFGSGFLTGKVASKQLKTAWSYNFNTHWNIEYNMTIQDATIKNIAAQFEQDASTLTLAQKTYLEQLNKKLPSTFHQFGFSEAQILGSFSHTFDNFANLDFVDLTIRSGIILPSQYETTTHSLFAAPLSSNTSFRYPLYINTSIGVLDWLTLGYFGNIIVSQTTQSTFPINHTNTNNHLLISESYFTRYKPGTIFSTGIYLEADHLIDMVSCAIGYTYTQQSKSSFTPTNKNLFPQLEANKPATMNKWSKGTIHLQLEIDFATKEKPNAPLIKLSYCKTIKGRLAAQSSSWTGSFGLQFCYNF